MKITKIQLILIGILLLGFVLRLIAVYHIDIEADELVISTRAINFISAGRLSTPDQEPLYHYLTDLAYRFLGVNPLSTRLMPLISSLLSIILVYYIAREFFNQKIACISAFFLSINHFFIRFMLEPDLVAGFFALLSTLLFIRWIKNRKSLMLYSSALALGLGLMNKPTIIMILPAFVLLLGVSLVKKRVRFDQQLISKLLICLLIVLICLTPIFAYNYLLYKEKGITDILFARFLDVNKEPYKGLSGIEDKFVLSSIPKGMYNHLTSFWQYDPIIFSLALIGVLIFLFRIKQDSKYGFILAWLFFPFAFIAGSTSVPVHYTILFPFFCILGADAFFFITKLFKTQTRINLIYPFLGVVFLGTMLMLIPTLTEKSSTIMLREFAETIPKDSFVLVDSRAYRGIIAYAFNDKHYLETNNWIMLQSEIEKLKQNAQPIDTYIIECESDKCGWSDVEGINATNEGLFDRLKDNMIRIKTIKGAKYTYNLYHTVFNINPAILQIADSTHGFYYFPVGYKNKEQLFDYYEPKTNFDSILNWTAYLVIYIETLLAIIGMLLTLGYLFYRT